MLFLQLKCQSNQSRIGLRVPVLLDLYHVIISCGDSQNMLRFYDFSKNGEHFCRVHIMVKVNERDERVKALGCLQTVVVSEFDIVDLSLFRNLSLAVLRTTRVLLSNFQLIFLLQQCEANIDVISQILIFYSKHFERV